jgi:hypothetical protein
LLLAGIPSQLFAAPVGSKQAAEISRLVRASMAQSAASESGPVAELIQRAKKEPEPALQKIAVSSLLRNKLPLMRSQKKEILRLVRDPVTGLLPKTLPIPRTGTIEVRHYSMSEFVAADLAQLERLGFELKKTPKGTEARLGRIHVLVRETGDNVLRDLADPDVHVIMYNGHSQLGGVVEQGLAQAGLQPPAQRKLVALFQCTGTQTLPLLKAMAPMADVITSNTPLYVTEGSKFVGELYQAIEKDEGYQRIRRRFDKVASAWGRLVLPNQTVTLKHMDFDGNGKLDVHQRPGQIEILDPTERRSAEHLMSGVHFLRTVNSFVVEETPGAVFDHAQGNVQLRAMGLVAGDGRSVTHITERGRGEQRRFEVGLDAKFKDAPPLFVGAATVFELQLHLQKALLGRADAREKMRALAFAAKYLEVIPRLSADAQDALDRLTALAGLPKLNWWNVRIALEGENILEEKQVDAIEKLVARAGEPAR